MQLLAKLKVVQHHNSLPDSSNLRGLNNSLRVKLQMKKLEEMEIIYILVSRQHRYRELLKFPTISVCLYILYAPGFVIPIGFSLCSYDDSYCMTFFPNNSDIQYIFDDL